MFVYTTMVIIVFKTIKVMNIYIYKFKVFMFKLIHFYFIFSGRLINAISQVKQLIVTRTTDSFPNESQELTKVSEKISKNATSMYMIL